MCDGHCFYVRSKVVGGFILARFAAGSGQKSRSKVPSISKITQASVIGLMIVISTELSLQEQAIHR